MSGGGPERLFYVGELGPALTPFLGFPSLGPRLSVLDAKGQLRARLSAGSAGIGRLIAPHGIALDSYGDIYIGEVNYTAWPMVFPDSECPRVIPTLHKLRRVRSGI
jgi:hypothetical protein